ncbi:MAG: hypothetical protein OXC40_00520, partial [Proteobacteria bacterium]|nr:hypothetical protein [Pseudomonadota bacterium]
MSVIAVPSYDKYKVRATQAEAKATLSRIFTAQELYYSQHDCYAEDGAGVPCDAGLISSEGAADNALVDKLAIKISPSVKYFYGTGGGTSGTAADQTKKGATSSGSKVGDNATKFKVFATAKKTRLAGCSSTDTDKWCLDSSGYIGNKAAEITHSDATLCLGAEVENGGCD